MADLSVLLPRVYTATTRYVNLSVTPFTTSRKARSPDVAYMVHGTS